MGKPYYLLLIIIALGSACQNKKAVDGTAEMVSILQQRHAQVIATDITYYYNSERAAALDSIRKTKKNFEEYVSYSYWYVRETLNSGDTESAIQLINGFFTELEESGKQLTGQWDYFMKRLLAVAYIRLGEQENCLSNHSSSSCILPIQGNGIHEITEGSEMAISIIEDLLVNYPEDLELVWLLNICHQTLGSYPEGVPREFRLPKETFNQQHEVIEPFNDLAHELGVANRSIAGGSIVEDFNNDGYLDIVASSSGTKESDQLVFYVNNGDGTFTDQTDAANLQGLVGGLNCMQTDYNNDGWIDIFVLRGGWFAEWGQHPNSLLRNNQDGTFTDVTKEAGLLSFHPTQTAVWADFNNDGAIDVFIGNESTSNTPRGRINKGKYHECELYINQGDGSFKDLAKEAGLNTVGLVKGVTTIDANGDEFIDLYISVMGGTNKLFINKGNLKFEEKAQEFNVTEPFVSFPVAALDFNNDGLEDLLVGSYTTSNNPIAHEVAFEMQGNQATAAIPRLFKNTGNNKFEDVTTEVGLNKSVYGMGFNFGDLDNDGFLDIYFGTGDPNFESIIPNRMFRNIKGEKFEEVSYAGGFANIQKGHGISWGDMDNDGDQDIYITMGGAHEGDIYQNQLLVNPINESNWISLQLEGDESPHAAIGAKVQIELTNGNSIFRRVSSGASFGANSFLLEIGLGESSSIKQVLVQWPNSKNTESFTDLKVKNHYLLKQGNQKAELLNRKALTFGNLHQHEN